MTFNNYYWVFGIIPLVLFLVIFFYYNRKKKRDLMYKFAALRLLPGLMLSYSPSKAWLKYLLFSIACVLLFVCLARPQWGHRFQEQHAKGIDVLFVLDVSKSMLSQDVKPNRLEKAKFSIFDLIPKLNGDRLGLIVFAGDAFLQCPMTYDYSAFAQTLQGVDTSTIHNGGTNISAAIKTAQGIFSKGDNFKFIVMITDGEDLEAAGIHQARSAAEDDIIIYTVGVGTSKGDLIPLTLPNGSTDFVKDESGKPVKTKLDEKTLQTIASVTGGFYVPLGPTGQGLEEVYNKGLNTIPKQELSSSLRKIPLERYQIPLGVAIVLLVIELLMSNGKRQITKSMTNGMLKVGMGLLVCYLFFISSNNLEASASSAYKAYQDKDFSNAVKLYQDVQKKSPTDHKVNYNLAASLYQNKNYNEAAHAFTEALQTTDLHLQQTIFYNLANTQYRIGEDSIQTNHTETRELWEEALKNYQHAIELNDQDAQAKENYEFVKKKLEELKQQQQEEEQKQQDKQQNQDKKDPQSNQDQSGKQNNSQNQEDQKSDPNNRNSANKNQQQNQQQGQSKSSEGSQNNQSQGQPQPIDHQLSKEQADQILKALEDDEKNFPTVNAQGDRSVNNNFKDW